MKWVVMRSPNLPADQTVTVPAGSVPGYVELLGFEVVPEAELIFDAAQDTGPHNSESEAPPEADLIPDIPAEPAPGE
jgi:hypothetical protein